jgi:predicted DNA-binding transcriptional regulator AlpA
METNRSGQNDGDDPRIQRLPPYLSLAMVGNRVLQLKRTATHAVVSRTDFPAPFDLEGRHRLWVTSEVIAWLERQQRALRRAMPTGLAAARHRRDSNPPYRATKPVP